MNTFVTVELVSTQCPGATCRRMFGLLRADLDKIRREHSSISCPFCQNGIWWPNKSDLELLKEEREKAEAAKRWAEQRMETERAERARLTRERNAARGVVTRIKNRVKHGVCPHCNRTFSALARHMATKHPEAVCP